MIPIGINDIITIAALGWKLIQWCSKTRDTCPQTEYRDLNHDIEAMSKTLDSIKTELQAFNSVGSGLETSKSLTSPSRLDLAALYVAVSGASETLTRCEELLWNNPKFQWSNGFIVSIQWNSDVAKIVKALQSRMQFHCTKITLVVQPLQMHIQNRLVQIITDLHDDVNTWGQTLSRQLERIEGALKLAGFKIDEPSRIPLTVPETIARRFATAAASKICTGIDGLRDYLDAIVFHYEASTRRSDPPPSDTVQYLSLLKCFWLFQELEQSRLSDEFCHDTFLAAYLDQLKQRVNAQWRRFKPTGSLEALRLDEILQEHEDQFTIWPNLDRIDTTPSITEAQDFEIELFKIPLQSLIRNRDRNLTVFRSGEDSLRLVEVISGPNVAGESQEVELDCGRVVLVPLYAHPDSQSSCSFSWKSSATIPKMKELPIKERSMVLRFQEAITNFTVCADLSGLTAIQGKLSTLKLDKDGTKLGDGGHIQLWVYSAPGTGDMLRRENSVASGNSSSGASSSVRSWSHDYLLQRNPRSSLRSDETGNFLDSMVPSQLVLFTTYRKQVRLISITLNEDTIINYDMCDCKSLDEKKAAECKRFVLRQKSRGMVKVKIYDTASNGANADISKFNVALLRHPSHDDAESDLKEFKFVTLDLKSVATRLHLCKRLHKVLGALKGVVESYNTDFLNMKNLQLSQKND